MNEWFELTPMIGFLTATLRMSTPLLLAALGELIAERAGVLNLGVEGMLATSSAKFRYRHPARVFCHAALCAHTGGAGRGGAAF